MLDVRGQLAALFFGLNAVIVLGIATLDLPALLLTAAMALAGFLSGVIAPSRDMLVRAAAPAGTAGRAFGIVSTGFNIGGIASPLLFGWIMDQTAKALARSTPPPVAIAPPWIGAAAIPVSKSLASWPETNTHPLAFTAGL